MTGLPATTWSLAVVVSSSGPGLGWAPGARCGQTGRVVWPDAGGQAGVWASRLAEIPITTTRKRMRIHHPRKPATQDYDGGEVDKSSHCQHLTNISKKIPTVSISPHVVRRQSRGLESSRFETVRKPAQTRKLKEKIR